MTLLEDIRKLQQQMASVEDACETTAKVVARHDEQINGERGISSAINSQTKEIQSLRKAAYWVAGIIVASSIAFAFSVLILIPPG